MESGDVRHITISIRRSAADVYAFASDPRNLPRWAAGLAGSEVSEHEGQWVTDSPMGRIRIRFAAENALGVLDHDVWLASGEVVHNPMRVVPNGDGSEVTFTLMRRAGMTDAELAADAAAVARDLRALKQLLEGTAPHRSPNGPAPTPPAPAAR